MSCAARTPHRITVDAAETRWERTASDGLVIDTGVDAGALAHLPRLAIVIRICRKTLL